MKSFITILLIVAVSLVKNFAAEKVTISLAVENNSEKTKLKDLVINAKIRNSGNEPVTINLFKKRPSAFQLEVWSEFIGIAFLDQEYAEIIYGGDARLNGAKLKGALFNVSTLFGADLKDADVTNARFIGANFFSANVSGVDFSKAYSIYGANFIDAKGYKAAK